jgi:5-methylcytosine-specific restriction endonuclease McrA
LRRLGRSISCRRPRRRFEPGGFLRLRPPRSPARRALTRRPRLGWWRPRPRRARRDCGTAAGRCASVSVLVRDGDDITTVSKPTRTIPAKLRRAVEARYPTCGVKTCANDRFLEIDHVVAVEDHGRTEDANLWRICPRHHKLKTHYGWKVVGSTHDWDLAPPDDPDPP